MAGKAATYSGDPSTSPKDAIRFWTGDTKGLLFTDREIKYVSDQTPNVKIAAAELLEAKANEFAQKADIRVGDVQKSFSEIAENMRKAAKDLRCDATRRALPFFGGLTKSGKRALAARTDDVQPAFAIGEFDSPWAVQLNSDLSVLQGLVGPGVI